MQQILNQLEYRLIKRRLEAGSAGWAEWIEDAAWAETESIEELDSKTAAANIDPLTNESVNSTKHKFEDCPKQTSELAGADSVLDGNVVQTNPARQQEPKPRHGKEAWVSSPCLAHLAFAFKFCPSPQQMLRSIIPHRSCSTLFFLPAVCWRRMHLKG